jgi:two-component system chemotaxis response regulator CheY
MASFPDISVLLLEDEDTTRTAYRFTLDRLGVRAVHAAATPDEALALLAANPVDIILCDYELGAMTGAEFVRRLRGRDFPAFPDADRLNPEVPVIILTLHTRNEIVQTAIRAGADHYIVKPVSANSLKERIAYVLRKRERDAAQTPK